ncbi:hypothetical protein E5161_15300 [Cohnella pontilimi]|uniref:Uncharacterized protein n=1 Tax=Cohnella pontilimi TaxID=2564100 RepID=A0A4V5LS40_9BACL|nr:hypothetical protein [Cohnella pontilimi]TJY41069.1 hypothetical protein E5161_15300 [Cohnella pontilimi]
MEHKIKRYYQLKEKQREIDQELSELRQEILSQMAEQGPFEWETGGYRVKVMEHYRREYDDHKLYGALPDADVWRLVSRADPAKIAGMVKLKVISEDLLKDTYTLKKVLALQVDRK